jgi:hypothetical protein
MSEAAAIISHGGYQSVRDQAIQVLTWKDEHGVLERMKPREARVAYDQQDSRNADEDPEQGP